MKILSPLGKYGTSWWGNVRPLLIIGFVTLTPAVLCLPLVGLFAGGSPTQQLPKGDLTSWLIGAVIFPAGFAVFMGTWCFMWGIVIDRQLKKQ